MLRFLWRNSLFGPPIFSWINFEDLISFNFSILRVQLKLFSHDSLFYEGFIFVLKNGPPLQLFCCVDWYPMAPKLHRTGSKESVPTQLSDATLYIILPFYGTALFIASIIAWIRVFCELKVLIIFSCAFGRYWYRPLGDIWTGMPGVSVAFGYTYLLFNFGLLYVLIYLSLWSRIILVKFLQLVVQTSLIIVLSLLPHCLCLNCQAFIRGDACCLPTYSSGRIC